MIQRDTTILVIAVALVSGGFGFLFGRLSINSMPSVASEPLQREAPLLPGSILAGSNGNTVAIDDQSPGTRVTVDSVTLARDGWIVVHEDRGGAPGNILGARRLNTGTEQNFEVELLRPTTEGGVYYAMIHEDDGDRVFDHTRDMPLRNAEGDILFKRFIASTEPRE